MKMWLGYGSEHSANLVIIGKFENGDEARKARKLLIEAARVAEADEKAGHIKAGRVASRFTDAQMELFRRTELSLNYGDYEQLLYEFNAEATGDQVVIATEESDINVFMKVLLHGGAKIEVYSAHDHGGPHGRRTKES